MNQHWHGLSLSTAPYADGSPQASQWPIPPGRFFDYELYPAAFDAGTSFYHSHVGFQSITASGALIVKDAVPPPYAYDDEVILKIGDFYPEDDRTIETQLTSVPWKWTGDPSALLINGQSGTAPSAQNAYPTDPSCEPWTMNVEPDKVYRVRLIASTALSLVVLGFEDHDNLTIIETDNSYVYPVETSYMQAHSGQRFSFLLKTKTLEELEAAGGKTGYWIQFETREAARVVSAWALLSYNVTNATQNANLGSPGYGYGYPYPGSASASAPQGFVPPASIPVGPVIDLPANVTDWLEYTFENPPLPGYDPPPTSSEVTRRITISTLQFLNITSGHTVMVFNNASWFDSHPLGPSTATPYLVELLSNGTINSFAPDHDAAIAASSGDEDVDGGGGYDRLSKTYPARIGEVVEIVWQNSASYPGAFYGPHPLHAHGGPYWDMGSGPGLYTPAAHDAAMLARSGALKRELADSWPGSRRDTTILYKYTLQSPTHTPDEVDGWRVWRVRVTPRNVGVWMFHCHILQHMVMGQQTVWVFGTPEEIRDHVWPVQGSLDGYFTFGGDVVGKTTAGAGTVAKANGDGDGEERGGEVVNVVQFFD